MATNPAHAKGPYIGIDFGTTKTMVAVYDPDRRTAISVTLGRGRFELPTSIYYASDGGTLFGDEADDEGLTDSLNHIRRFKTKLGKSGFAHVGKRPATAVDLTADYLRYVRFRLVQEVVHTEVNRIALTVPALFGPAQRVALSGAAEQAGFTEVELLAEPSAAGTAYLDHHSAFGSVSRFLVADWGGGTFDVALIERTPSGDLQIDPSLVTGMLELGGENLDDDLWTLASNHLERLGYGRLDSQNPIKWGSYRRELSSAKERLSSMPVAKFRFVLGGDPVSIELKSSDFESVIRPKVEDAVGFVSRLLVECGRQGRSPEFILLAGGTSRIPLFGELLGKATGLECRQWSSGRESIALGAAIHAFRVFGAGAEAPRKTAVEPGIAAPNGRAAAMAQYRRMLEGPWTDWAILDGKRAFLEKKKAELGLSDLEARALEVQVLGVPLSEAGSSKGSAMSAGPTGVPFRIGVERSEVGLQVLALDAAARAEVQLDELIEQTHFPMIYLVKIENTTGQELHSARVSLKSADNRRHSMLLPIVAPGEEGTLSLTTADFEGWCVKPGDVISVDVQGSIPATFEVPDEGSWNTESQLLKPAEFPCIVRLRKSTWGSNYVLKLLNNKSRKIRVVSVESAAGTLNSPLEIGPYAEGEIGWCELSGSSNFKVGDQFVIGVEGYRTIKGVIAEDQTKGGGTAWKVLAALGGIALAAAGAG